jgi:hypothetical protein
MPEDEKKAMVKLVIKMVGRLPGVSRQKAAESMVERTNWGAMEVKEDMERDTYCSVCHDEVSPVLPWEIGMALEKWLGLGCDWDCDWDSESESESESETEWELGWDGSADSALIPERHSLTSSSVRRRHQDRHHAVQAHVSPGLSFGECDRVG